MRAELLSYPIDPQLKNAAILASYALFKQDFLMQKVHEIVEKYKNDNSPLPALFEGPFRNEREAENAVVEAGAAIADMGYTNTVFGNVSAVFNGKLYISATGSNLKNLKNEIAFCNMEGDSLNKLKPSVELPSHLEIVKQTDSLCILHAHPFFTIVYTMIEGVGKSIFKTPVVGGDVGGGDNGIVKTVPFALKNFNTVAVYAHGVFASDPVDFNKPLRNIMHLEHLCRTKYIENYLIKTT
ncbi:MAG: class II aldolase/adducin family protein [bacterium]